MISIRRFLILVSLAATIVVTFIATFQGYRSGTLATQALLDKQLSEKIQLLHADATSPALNTPNQLFQVFDAQGQLLRGSAGAPALPLTDESRGYADISHDGTLWRTLAAGTPEGGRIVVAERRALQFEVVDEVVLQTLLPIGIGIPVLALVIGVIITYGLRHLRTVEQELRARSAHNLQTLDIDVVPQELQPLLDTTNSLLDQLDAAFQREQRFAGDAAHELRTPVSALKIDLYNLSKRLPPDDADVNAIKQNLDRMGHIIEQLLMLYRASSDQLARQFAPLEIQRVCQETVAELYPQIQARRQDISLEGDDCTVNAHRYAVGAMLKNLIDNASKYSPEGTTIEVRTTRAGDSLQIDVVDAGPGIPDSLKNEVQGRFVRGSSAMHSKIVGCGLGLSIVDLAVKLHRGVWAIHNAPSGRGTWIAVTLPIRGTTP